MSIFNKFMEDVFSNKDFLQQFVYKGQNIPCICSPIAEGAEYTDAGVQSTQNFTLDVQNNVRMDFKKNQKVIFRNKTYKIISIDTDSANASKKIYLVALSKGI